VLVHDDLDMPLGRVRTYARGGDGGHRGVRSVLQAFRTDAVRRVKIGIGHPGAKDKIVDYVLTDLSPERLAVVDKACVEAVDRIRELLHAPHAAEASARAG
jgi:PTH1 family peptidyl-tRNA hydrolase